MNLRSERNGDHYFMDRQNMYIFTKIWLKNEIISSKLKLYTNIYFLLFFLLRLSRFKYLFESAKYGTL